MKTIKLSIVLILLTTLLTSCGKKRNNRNNTGVSTQTVQVNQDAIYLQCSNIQVANNCLDHTSNREIPPRFFYYRGCYAQYTRCLVQSGIPVRNSRF